MGQVAIAPIIMVAMAAIGTGLSIYGNIQAKKTAERQAAQGLRSQDAQLKVAESTGNLQAQQQSADRTRRYAEIISSQSAIWASRGIQLQSGTVRNVADQSTDAYGRDLDTIEMNRLNRLASLALQGADVQYAAAAAVGAAHTRMVSGIANSLFSFAGTAVGSGSKIYDFGATPAAAGSGGMPGYSGTTAPAGMSMSGRSPGGDLVR